MRMVLDHEIYISILQPTIIIHQNGKQALYTHSLFFKAKGPVFLII